MADNNYENTIDSYDISDHHFKSTISLPVLALRGMVVFPGSVTHFDIGRQSSAEAIKAAMKADQMLFICTQTDPMNTSPTTGELYEVGTVSRILQVVKQSDNSIKVIIEGLDRGLALSYKKDRPYFEALVSPIELDEDYTPSIIQIALMREIRHVFEEYVEFSPKMPSDILHKVEFTESPSKVCDYVAN
ncbi:MAG: LON peptidase substrate-binding domain-containing protein, partial [Clostridia bacterium]|nr:LON peptidase substrate-binding domain-containing protein [Clostridia bacterium]